MMPNSAIILTKFFKCFDGLSDLAYFFSVVFAKEI